MADEAPKFEIADLTDLDRTALLEARIKVRSEIDRLGKLGDDASDEEIAALEAALDHVVEIDQRIEQVDTEATERANRIAAARERAESLAEAPEEPVAEEPAAVVEEPAAEAVVEEPVAVAEVEPEPVLASGTKRPVARAAAATAPTVIISKEKEGSPVKNSIVAAANVPEFASGEELADMSDVAKAFMGRVGQMGISQTPNVPTGTYQMSPHAARYGVARIKREGTAFSVDKNMDAETQMRVLMDASSESGRAGGSLIAAGGWCAPSETIYELFGYETSEGTLDLPEVTAKRGGISFTKGPDFMTIFGDADAGFIQTETQAEAGAKKAVYALDCPDFTEVRLDAIGFAATAPLLTQAAYPELVKRVLDMLGAGHARRKSQSSINRIIANITSVINWGELGGTAASGVSDALAALELQALRIRQLLAMSPTATIEGFAPYWIKAAFRNELSRRLGLTDPHRVSDADVEQFLAIRNIKLQFVYDYQMLTTANTATWTKFPDKVEFTLYPAGAYTRLVNDVISLDAVYDHDLLTGNEYTAAFVEEGIAVANTRGFGVRVEIDLRYNGSAGFPGIGSGAGVTFAAPVGG